MTIAMAVEAYASGHGHRLPPSLEPLMRADESGVIFLHTDRVPLDPWGRPYCYELTSRMPGFRVYSLGEDGRPGGEGEDGDIDSRTLLCPTTSPRPTRGR